jgi:hypothetical protein
MVRNLEDSELGGVDGGASLEPIAKDAGQDRKRQVPLPSDTKDPNTPTENPGGGGGDPSEIEG